MRHCKYIFMLSAPVIVGVLFLYLACSNKTTPPQLSISPVQEPLRGEIKSDWRTEWEKALTDGKKEGRVIVQVIAPSPATSQFLSKTFKEKFGIDVDLSGLPSAIAQEKFQRERKAGIFNLDINLSSMGTSFLFYEKIDFPEILDNEFILPEVKHSNVWMDGSIFLDKGHKAAGGFAGVNCLLFVNSQLVRPGEIKSLDDLLDPKWKGKIIINDPSISGTGNAAMRTIMMFKSEDFLKKLVEQNPVVTRDARIQTEWVARGKYAVSIGPSFGIIKDFIATGSPLAYVLPQEGAFLSNSPGVVLIPTNAPHPNAAKIFLNWILTREAQTQFTIAQDTASRRLDVSAEHLALERRPRLDVRYIKDNDEVFLSRNEELTNRIKEIFKPVL